ncbi:ABC-2 transporter permease [Clostridioides sp. ZZV14-6345]|uniref:ABC-2 transporter permease n=1 Tax=Clostridioides sp. ZZV14-6345 TaxID=2811496 RepID=UPI001D116AA2|nr:ABC-2 transporter permease [Clostridioides sp. ZZV14-6345]
MRGLIYKDLYLFLKSIDKRLIIIAIPAITILIMNMGIYAGLMTSIMLSITIGMQNIISFANDENVNWRRYQLALPISGCSIVASKYISVICTLAFSLAGSVVFSLISSIFYGSFEINLFGLSIITAIILPLACTGICLPLTYWFGFRSAQTIGVLFVVPIFYFIKYFEDGLGFSAIPASTQSYLLIACIITIVLFIVSFAISVLGYSRKNKHI